MSRLGGLTAPTRRRPANFHRVSANPFAGVLVLTGFALVLDSVVTIMERRLMVWQPRSGETEKI